MDLSFDKLLSRTLDRMWNLVTIVPDTERRPKDYFHMLRDSHRQQLADFITKNDRFFKITFGEAGIFIEAKTNVIMLTKDEVVEALKDAYQLGLNDGLYRMPVSWPIEDGR